MQLDPESFGDRFPSPIRSSNSFSGRYETGSGAMMEQRQRAPRIGRCIKDQLGPLRSRASCNATVFMPERAIRPANSSTRPKGVWVGSNGRSRCRP